MRFLMAGCLFLLGACTFAATLAPTSMSASALAGGPITYLALGDSYTIGEGTASPAERWPNQLAALARAQGLPLADPDVIAKTGWTTTHLLAALDAAPATRTNYGLVSLLIGVNDQYDGYTLATFRAEFRRLLARATTYAGGRPGRVLVLSIPDWGLAPFARQRNPAHIGQQIDQFNAVAQDECQRAGIVFVNITPLTRRAGSADFVADGLHYAGAGMAPWAQQALGAVKQLL